MAPRRPTLVFTSECGCGLSTQEVLRCEFCHLYMDMTFHQPINLPCGHVLCSACVTALIKESELICPICQTELHVEEASDLPINSNMCKMIKNARKRQSRLFYPSTSFECLMNSMEVLDKEENYICTLHNDLKSYFCVSCENHVCPGCAPELHPPNLKCQLFPEDEIVSKLKRITEESLKCQLNSCEVEVENLHEHNRNIKSHEDLTLEALRRMRRESQQVESAISHGEEVRNALVLVRNIVEGAESLDDMKVALERSRELESRSVRWLDDNLDTFPLCTTPPSIAKWLVAGTSNGVYAEHIIDGVTRHSKLSWDGEKLLIHASRIDSPHPDAFILEFERVKCLAERSRYIVFLDLAWSGANPTRVCIEVDGESGRGERFVTLCTGERGPSYLGMGFNIGTADKGTLTSQKFREVPDGKLADMIIETRQCMKSVEIGMVGSGDIWQCDYTFNSVRQSEGTISQFCIYLQEHLIPVNTIFGSVVSGLRGVILAAAHYPISEVKIVDCGIIIPMKRKNISTHDDL